MSEGIWWGLLGAAVWQLAALVLGYIFRDLIGAWIKGFAQHGFDLKIEKLRSELAANQKDIESLRANALSGAASRQVALDNRRLLAAEQIWGGVMALAPLRVASQILGSVNLEEASKAAPRNDGVRKMFEVFGKNIDIKTLPPNDAHKARPFATTTAWAFYIAYSAIVLHAAMLIKTLELGLDGTKFVSNEKIDKLLTTALPHYEKFIKDHGPSGYHLLLDEIEERLLAELQKMLEGKESDSAALKQAASILKDADSLKVQSVAAAANISQAARN